MGLFSTKNKNRAALIVDIGSGSVLVSIVHSSPQEKHPTIVWSHREQAPLRKTDSVSQSAKGVMAALVNACMKADAEGRNALHAHDPNTKISVMQTAISAPWSYTVTKSVNYKHEKPFAITEDLVGELIATAQRTVDEELKEKEVTTNLGLSIITRSTMDLLANGYRVADPEGEEATTVELSQATVVAQKYLIDVVEEMHSKLFPHTTLQKMSFMLLFYSTVRELMPKADDICLVDVTYEATEIGIVRDGVLKYSTHIPFGLFSLVREIAEITGAPLHEAFATIRSHTLDTFIAAQSDSKQEAIQTMFDAYASKLNALFHETGDTLSIPKRIALHADRDAEPLLSNIIERAAKQATHITHTTTSIAGEIVTPEFQTELTATVRDMDHDTAMILNALFFHMQHHGISFIYQ